MYTSKSKSRFAAISSLLALLVLLSGCSGLNLFKPEPVVYTVTFDLNGGTLVSGELEQQVEEGGAATAPKVENGTAILEWDEDFGNITGDLTVTAQWTQKELTSTEIAELVQKSTVTINCVFYNGNSGSGSGFFIDDEGTLVTSYHVIEYATSISVDVMGGGTYDVERIKAFSELNDLAILQIGLADSPGLTISAEAPKVGETVYANGSALGTLEGTFTQGTVSSVSRKVNGINCIQMDAAISKGNSGGPLVNAKAEVIGVNALSYIDGENLNLAVRIDNLKDLTNEVNYTVKNYEEWIMKEADRSYSPYDTDGFFYSTLNTYTTITGRACDFSVDFDEEVYDGYVDECEFYVYDYIDTEADAYVDYLKTKGFEFTEREEFERGVSYYYVNEWSGMLVDMFQHSDGQLYIWVSYE